jgi:hypothetical protein
LENLPTPPKDKKPEEWKEYEEQMKYAKQEFYNTLWTYEALLLKSSKTPQEFTYLFELPVSETAKHIIKNSLGE